MLQRTESCLQRFLGQSLEILLGGEWKQNEGGLEQFEQYEANWPLRTSHERQKNLKAGYKIAFYLSQPELRLEIFFRLIKQFKESFQM